MKTCAFCAELIKDEAIKCKHCLSMIAEPIALEPRPIPKWAYPLSYNQNTKLMPALPPAESKPKKNHKPMGIWFDICAIIIILTISIFVAIIKKSVEVPARAGNQTTSRVPLSEAKSLRSSLGNPFAKKAPKMPAASYSTRGNQYVNREYGFSIALPQGWEIDNTPADNVIVKAELNKDEFTSLMTVSTYYVGVEMDAWEANVWDMFNTLRAKYLNTEPMLLDWGRVKVNGSHALWMRVYFAKSPKGPVTTMTYYIVNNKTLFRLTASANGDLLWYNQNEEAFNKAIQSFFFYKLQQ